MKINKFGFGLEVFNCQHEKFTFINSRLMNARLFWFLTKNKVIRFQIPMPRLYYQTWNKEKEWEENHRTIYKSFIDKFKKVINK